MKLLLLNTIDVKCLHTGKKVQRLIREENIIKVNMIHNKDGKDEVEFEYAKKLHYCKYSYLKENSKEI